MTTVSEKIDKIKSLFDRYNFKYTVIDNLSPEEQSKIKSSYNDKVEFLKAITIVEKRRLTREGF